jgi:crossover junction endodeoxyribonuclease RuvC
VICIGIDPGLTGALAFLGHRGEFLAVEDIPTMARGTGKRQVNPRELREIIQFRAGDYDKNEVMIMIERVAAMPSQGVTSMFNFGHTAGMIEGVVAAMGFSYDFAAANFWKKDAGLLGKDKKESRAMAIRLFPEASLHRVKDEGRAEALLIARFGHRRHS